MKALVLAGQRPGGDPLARELGVAHKARITVGGIPMLKRVLTTLHEMDGIDDIIVMTERPDEMSDLGQAIWVEAASTPSLSVARALSEFGAPILVTTADHALLQPAHVEAFLKAAGHDHDLAVGLVAESQIKARFPDARRTYLRFRDGGYSGANLFLLQQSNAAKAVDFWRRVEANRKKPWHIAREFGIGLLMSYLIRRYELQTAVALAGQRMGVRAKAVVLPMADAAVDVDKLSDLRLAEEILASRP